VVDGGTKSNNEKSNVEEFKKEDTDDCIIVSDKYTLDGQHLVVKATPVTTEEQRILQEQNNNRLRNIELEINSVLKKKSEQFNCAIEKYFTTTQLLELLRNIQYLAKYIDNLCNCINSQYDIMNAYQEDIIHEFEFATLDSHNTYLQDKLNIFRNKRRDISNYRDDLELLKQFLYTIDTKELDSAISVLETQKFKTQQAKYIPKVDDTMYERYNWVFAKEDVHGDNSKNSANKILKTNKREQEQITKVSPIVSNKITNFRVSCVLYGGKYRVGKCWSRTYKCKDSYTAMKWAKQELNNLIDPNQGIFYKQLEVTNNI